MTNDRESRAPGKREPGNEFPSWFLESKTEKRGCNASKKCFGSKCAPFGVILSRGGSNLPHFTLKPVSMDRLRLLFSWELIGTVLMIAP